jgi:hypothetical protein
MLVSLLSLSPSQFPEAEKQLRKQLAVKVRGKAARWQALVDGGKVS